jgi:serine O-acetyltransferase
MHDPLDQPGFREMVRSDYARWNPDGRPSALRLAAALPMHPGLVACVLLRLQQVLVRRGATRLPWIVRSLCSALTGADFVPGCEVGLGVHFTHPVGVVIGSGVRIGSGATFASGVVLGVRSVDPSDPTAEEYADVGDDVFFGAHATIVGGVKVGDGAVIGANSLVRTDVEAASVVSGVPAVPVGRRGGDGDAARST